MKLSEANKSVKNKIARLDIPGCPIQYL